MLIGRTADQIQNKVWIYSVNEEIKFLQYGAELNIARFDVACGLFKSDKHDGRPLIVVAGYGFHGEEGSKTSEYWDFTSSGSKWTFCSK